MPEGSPGSCAVAPPGAIGAGTLTETPIRRQAPPAPREADAPRRESARPAPRRDARLRERLGAFLFFALVAAALYAGWATRGEQNLTPESGLGYALGITGATLMLLLALYPLRKRARFMRNAGPVRHWFRAHMIKGILGPTCILFHANFSTGSLNSNVALFAMLIVAGSGLAGRFIYTKVHYGLYGSRATLASLKEESHASQGALSARFPYAPRLSDQLDAVEAAVLRPRRPLARAWQLLTLGVTLRGYRNHLWGALRGALADHARKENWGWRERRRRRKEARSYVRRHLHVVRRVAEFSVYERVFGLWHVLHFPLFIMLIVAGVVHVFAVHMY